MNTNTISAASDKFNADSGTLTTLNLTSILTYLTPTEISDWLTFFLNKQARDRKNIKEILKEKERRLRAEGRLAEEIEKKLAACHVILQGLYSWPERKFSDFIRERAEQKKADQERRHRGMLLQ